MEHYNNWPYRLDRRKSQEEIKLLKKEKEMMLKVKSNKKMSVFQNHEAKWSRNFSISQDNIKNIKPMRDN